MALYKVEAIVKLRGVPVAGSTIQAFSGDRSEAIGVATSDENGEFSIKFDKYYEEVTVVANLEYNGKFFETFIATVEPRLAQDSNVTFTRPSATYDLGYNVLPANTPIRESVRVGLNTFTKRQAPILSLAADVEPWAYGEVLQKLKKFAAATAGAEYQDLSTITGGTALPRDLEQSAIKMYDDGERPVVIFHTCVHGNEQDPLRGVYEFINVLSTSNDPLYCWARSNLAFYWVALQNPVGYDLNKRRNADDADPLVGQNINRNYDYFWEYAGDPDKGAQAFSEPEAANLKNWLEPVLSRSILFVDWHMWQSKTTYGFLTDHQYKDNAAQRLHRSIYHYTESFMEQRREQNPITVNGVDNLKFDERKSSRKPYAPYWAKQFMREDGYAYQIELPQSESQSLNGHITFDTCVAALMGVNDALAGEVGGLLLAPAIAPEDVLNNNSELLDWNSSEPRPNWFSVSGLSLAHGSAADKKDSYLVSHRPDNSAWPDTISELAGTTVDTGDPSTSFMIVCGGRNQITNDSDNLCVIEYLAAPPAPAVGSSASSVYKPTVSQIRIDNLPVNVRSAACCHDGTYVYVSGGYTDNGSPTYNNKVWRIAIAGIEDNSWEEFHTLTNGVQRHGAVCYNGMLHILGGRHSGGYNNELVRIDLSTGLEVDTTDGIIPYNNGWFAHCLVGNKWWLSGGWGGLTTKDEHRCVDLDDLTQQRFGSTPEEIKQAGMYERDGELWIHYGHGVDGTVATDKVFVYNIADNTWVTRSYGNGYDVSDDLVDEEAGDLNLPSPEQAMLRYGYSGHYNPYTDEFLMIAGNDKDDNKTSSVIIYSHNGDEIHDRDANDVRWGYIRPSSKFVAEPDNDYSAVAVVKNTTEDGDGSINAYVRPAVYVGEWSNIQKARYAYTVPPKETSTLIVSTKVDSAVFPSNTDLRGYLRHYAGGSKIEVNAFQMIKHGSPCVAVDEDLGRAEDSMYVDVSFDNDYFGAFVPHFGSNHALSQVEVMDFVLDRGGVHSSIKLMWKAVAPISSTSGTYPDDNADGKFYLDVDGVEYDIVSDLELNHDRFIPFYKQDVVAWRVKNLDDGFEFGLWFYNRYFSTKVTTDQRITAYSAHGSSCTYLDIK